MLLPQTLLCTQDSFHLPRESAGKSRNSSGAAGKVERTGRSAGHGTDAHVEGKVSTDAFKSRHTVTYLTHCDPIYLNSFSYVLVLRAYWRGGYPFELWCLSRPIRPSSGDFGIACFFAFHPYTPIYTHICGHPRPPAISYETNAFFSHLLITSLSLLLIPS